MNKIFGFFLLFNIFLLNYCPHFFLHDFSLSTLSHFFDFFFFPLSELFFTLDTDKSGGLDQNEFHIFLHGLVKHGLEGNTEAVCII